MSSASLRELRGELSSAIERDRAGIDLAEEAHRLSGSLKLFVRAAWPTIMPRPITETWHIDSICEHVQAAYDRELPRLAITIQPGALKSSLVSVFAPAWQWTRSPAERLVTASWKDRLAERDARYSRTVITSRWYEARFGHLFNLSKDENLKTRYSNDQGGHRVATHVGGGTGDRGAILQLDDPHNAQDGSSEVKLASAVEWWGNTWVSRMDDLVDDPGVMVVIGQRINEADLIGHILDSGEWTHLCLPTRYERKHPLVFGGYPAEVELSDGRVITGDPRSEEGELLAPAVQTAEMLDAKIQDDGLTAHVFAGQYQQRPAPRAGKLLQRADWRYYDPALSYYSPRHAFGPKQVEELASRIGSFDQIVGSWDTSVKDRAHSDYVSGQLWGTIEMRRYLLRLWHERMGLNATIEAMLVSAAWVYELWPGLAFHTVIENSANGPDAVAEIKGRVDGVVLSTVTGSKWVRAEAAEPALVGHNCFLPGYATEAGDTYDSRTPMAVQTFVEELSVFDGGSHDDQVDGWSSLVNWTRGKGGATTISSPTGRVAAPRFHTSTRLRPGMR